MQKLEQLPNYSKEGFLNLDDEDERSINMFSVLMDMRNRPATVRPNTVMPIVKTDLKNTAYAKPTVIWFGHSSFLIKTKTANILVDPDFSGFAGPFSWFMKAFEGSNTYSADDMPQIDVLIISHDHYDHLDYGTVMKLKDKVKRVVVPLGIGSHFIYWGYKPELVHELNWGETNAVSTQVNITAMPSRHTSGRMLSAKKTLWASYVIEADGFKLFYSGDTGYGSHFKLIGEQYGPFDLAMMECGQYGKNWPQNHMFPSQTAQAAADLKARMILPVHWGKFAEANHPWNESVTRMKIAADSLNIPVTIPKIGQAYTVDSPAYTNDWWSVD
ncbi:MBL fold metallo-hydrolase [Mucilaginibacter gynuensis]|uniref:MBL fold metallo-hydrolase n=1 Tax=Mucilaginibacter gynuensis TaxID=1302236 RepID=A0ABP8FY97_9SPHI